MQASEVVIQTELYQTCTECEQRRRFRTDSTDEDALEVVYRCDNCDHAAVLTLDP